MAASLKPPALVAADYSIAQRPTLGGEIQVWACTEAAGIVKKIKNLGGGDYETRNVNPAGIAGCIRSTVVGYQGLHGAITGLIEVPLWAQNKSPNFPVGKAGVGTIPSTFGIRGDELVEVDIPGYDPSAGTPVWFEIGATDEKRFKIPGRMSKPIANGMISAEWVASGKTEIGELTVTAKDMGHEEGLRKIAGLNTVIMLRVIHNGVLEVARIFLLDWTPAVDPTNPAADGESTASATGIFSRMAVFTADGTP
jgi:hypothetical protein